MEVPLEFRLNSRVDWQCYSSVMEANRANLCTADSIENTNDMKRMSVKIQGKLENIHLSCFRCLIVEFNWNLMLKIY